MAEVVTLYKKEYLVGHLDEDLNPLVEMILENYHKGRNMAKESDDIRHEDIRINFTPQVQRIAKKLCDSWQEAFDEEIELCWQNKEGQDPNHSFWSVVHERNEMTNIHTHESSENYSEGAHISAAFWVQVPPNSGDFVGPADGSAISSATTMDLSITDVSGANTVAFLTYLVGCLLYTSDAADE